MKPRHPTQPLVRDNCGVIRFKSNPIVEHLLRHLPGNMNALALLPFSDEDRAHFAQLIGYSVSGWGDLEYVADGCREWLDEVDAEAEKVP